MKKLLLALALVSVMGCKPATTTQPLAPGYTSQTDQQIGQELAAANGFYASINCAIKGLGFSPQTKTCDPNKTVPKYNPQGAELTTLTDLHIALNQANPIYNAFHAGGATLAQAQAAVNNVLAKQAAAETVLPQSLQSAVKP